MKNRIIRLMAKSAFEQINEEIFDGKLPHMAIHTRKHLKRELTYACYQKAQMWIFTDMLKECGKFLPHQIFAIVAHEIIHHAQFAFHLFNIHGGRSYNHNGAFFRHYARKMEKAYGHKIEALQERYEE